jgi:hypothetical protein
LTKKKLTRLLMPPEVSQAIARKVVSAEVVIAEVVTAAEVETAEVETKASATMRPEAVTEVIAEIVLTEETAETAEVASAEEASAEAANAEAENVVSVDLKAKVVKIKSAVVEIAPGLQDLPDQRVILDRMITVKEEEVLAATEVVSEAAVVEPNLLLPTLVELMLDLLAERANLEAEVASEEASEAAAVASLVREERVVSTDQKVEINPDPMTASIPEAEVVREGLVLLVATVEEMPHSLPIEYHREIFENYDL